MSLRDTAESPRGSSRRNHVTNDASKRSVASIAGMCPTPDSSTHVAVGISCAMSRPCATGVTASADPQITSEGTRIVRYRSRSVARVCSSTSRKWRSHSPYVVVVRSRLIGFDRNLEEAAKDLGASSFDTFRLITLPLIMPGIFGGAMLAFALSIDDFVISNFNSGTTVTFPLYIFGAAQRGIPVEVNVIAMILFFFTVGAMGFATWQQRRAEKLASVRPDQETGMGMPVEAPAAG